MQTESDSARRERRRDVVVQSIVGVALTGLTAVRPAKLTTRGRMLFRAALATLTGVSVHSSLSPAPVGQARSLAAALTTASVGVTLGLAEAIEALDERLHRGLQRRGVQRPRLVLMAATFVFSALSVLLGAVLDRRSGLHNAYAQEQEEYGESDLPEPLRELTAVILGATDDFGAAQLREQLVNARAQLYQGENVGDFWPTIGLIADPGLPRAVPGNGRFPVIGRFYALGGLSFDLHLMLDEGRLELLTFDTGNDWTEEARLDWFESEHDAFEVGRWPRPEELTLLIETPNGYAELSPARGA